MKYVYKLLPYDYYEIDAIEEWLDELAAEEGLFFPGRRLFNLCAFERGAPARPRYRIDVKGEAGYRGEEERVEVYGEMGWDYVCGLSPKMDVYRAQSPDAPELNSDEEILRRQLHKQTRNYIISAAASVALLLAILLKDASLWTEALRRGFYGTLVDG